MLKGAFNGLIVYSLLLIFHCGNNPVESIKHDKYGFSLKTYSYHYLLDSTLYVEINFNNVLYIRPKISINESIIDSGYSPTNFIFPIHHFTSGKFTYKILFEEDTLIDTVNVPLEIDTISCNGILLSDIGSTIIDTADTFHLLWKKYPTYNRFEFEAYCFYKFAPSYPIISTDTSITIYSQIPAGTPSSDLQGYIQIRGLGYSAMTANSIPNKESNHLFIYYDSIFGPYRTVYFVTRH